MATRGYGGEEGEYLDEEEFNVDLDDDGERTEEDYYESDEQEDQDYNSDEVPVEFADEHGEGDFGQPKAEPIPAGDVREDLGFQRARRRLTVPDAELGQGEVDDGMVAGLTVVDRFGVVLVSCATGERGLF